MNESPTGFSQPVGIVKLGVGSDMDADSAKVHRIQLFKSMIAELIIIIWIECIFESDVSLSLEAGG